jgi:tRNA(Ile)-lysidine synthase
MSEKAVIEFCNKHNIKSCKVLLAVSGGSDSVALFHLFVLLKEQLSLEEIGVVHVNHGLRPEESDREEVFVSQLADQEGCRFHVRRLGGKSSKDSGIEQWAREERYAFFKELKEKYGYQYIATGHTADDQAETVLMRIYRGSGLTGLCGIKAIREDGVIRPLLKNRRTELAAWLERNGKAWCEDRSNLDQKYTRNHIRHSVIPKLAKREPNIVEYLARFAEYMQEQMQSLMPLINKWIEAHVIEEGSGRFVLRKPDKKEESFPASEGIALLFRKHDIPFEKKHIVNFLKCSKRRSGCFLLKGGWKFFPGRDSVEVVSEEKIVTGKGNVNSCSLRVPGETVCRKSGYTFITTMHTKGDCKLEYDVSNNTVFLDSEVTGEKLFIREVKKTDTFKPLGFGKSVTIIKFLKNRYVSTYYRNSMYVLADNADTVIWIPGVAIGHEYRITDTTESLIKISRRRFF